MQTIFGIILGAVLTYLALEHDYEPPAVLQIPSKIQAATEGIIASSFINDAGTSLKQRQKSVAILIKGDPNYFIEIDNAIDNRFTREAVSKVARRRLQIIQQYDSMLDKAFDAEEHQALRNYYEQKLETTDLTLLKARYIMKEIQQDPLVYNMVRERYPNLSNDDIGLAILGKQAAPVE
jgi:hypothetical protein